MRKLKILLILISVLLVSCAEKDVSDSRIAMGTLISVTVPEENESVIDEIFSLVYSIEHDISSYSEDSWIGKINASAGISPVSVPSGIYALIKQSVAMAYCTDGVFNPAIGPLTKLWGLGTESARVPSESEIESVLPFLDYSSVVLDDSNCSVFLPTPGMALDLGGVGKGYAADKISKLLSDRGVERAIVNLGGNVLAFGCKADGSAWKIGIRNPLGGNSDVFRTVEVENMCVITSGVYQRYIIEDGIRYHHILSSETGYPVVSDIISATVVSSSGTLGDLLSTTLLAQGSEKALETAAEYEVRCILVLADGTVLDSDGPDGKIAIPEE